MVATAPARVATSADADYESYQTVVQLVSKGISKGILDALGELKDPTSFTHAVTRMADEHGAKLDAAATDLYNGFWTLANGLSAELNWESSAGVPVRSTVIADSLKPVQQPVSTDGIHPRFGIGFEAFGCGIHLGW
ncbi:hypothetical protein ABZ642_40395 [Streptomyces sp. NPDC007157]|uniref:hypothetical protein n=1 Tax=Streptomyces sp. NPDC007157 TaxID=3154681 RepID=UPI0033FD7315